MSSGYGKSNTNSGNFNNFDLDLGLNSSRSRPLNGTQKQTHSYSSYASKPGGTAYKPSWTHQPADQSQNGRVGSLSGPANMAGDIFGKNWTSSTPAVSSSGAGIPIKDPSLFGDLVSPVLGKNKGNSNVPLKNVAASVGNKNMSSKKAAPFGNKSSFSMGGTGKGSSTGISGSFGSFTNGVSTNSGAGVTGISSGSANKGNYLGGPPLKNMPGVGSGSGLNRDPFVSLVDFGSKGSGNTSLNRGTERSNKNNDANDAFKDFQKAPETNPSPLPSGNNSSTGTTAGVSNSNLNDFVFPSSQPNNQPSVPSTGFNEFNSWFPSTGGTERGSKGVPTQQIPVIDDMWNDPMSGGGNDQGGTTELEGLPPPPAGISASTAKSKGLECQKQGQYADAIKWLSWAIVLIEKAGESNGTTEVLSCRASCFKEIGENKKAVADCSKVLEKDGANISVLVQRALLYESMEKYKLGAQDLRTVMKYDPSNRVAKSTIHRLVKMAE